MFVSPEQVFPLCLIFLVGKFDGEHGQNEVEHDDKAVGELHDNSTARVEQIRVYREGILHHIIAEWKQEEQKECGFVFIF